MSTSQKLSASASSSTTSQPTPQLPSTPPSHQPRRAACSGGLEFHYAPEHASWLNMVRCSKANVSIAKSKAPTRLVAEIDVWQTQRNQSGARINWMFSTDKTRTKMARAHPDPSLKES